MWTLDYFLIWVLLIIIVLFFMIDIDRLIKIIIANYILILITLWISQMIEVYDYMKFNNLVTLNINFENQEDINKIIREKKTIVILFIYFLVLLTIFSKSKINSWIWSNKFANIIFKLIIVPLAAINLITTMEILYIWPSLLYSENIIKYSTVFTNDILLRYWILLIPLWLCLPWIAIVLVTIRFRLFGNKWHKKWNLFKDMFKRKKKVKEETLEENSLDIEENPEH